MWGFGDLGHLEKIKMPLKSWQKSAWDGNVGFANEICAAGKKKAYYWVLSIQSSGPRPGQTTTTTGTTTTTTTTTPLQRANSSLSLCILGRAFLLGTRVCGLSQGIRIILCTQYLFSIQ